MENNYEQFLKEFPQRLAKQIENSDAFKQALVFASEKEKKDGDLPIKSINISNVEILISFSLQNDAIATSTDFPIHIPEEIYNS